MRRIEAKSKAVLYCRYSSHAQRDVSIDQQVKACRQYAEAHGMEILKIYDDRAVSGTNDRRPKFQQMIAEAADLNYDYVLVYSLDRFARDRYDSAVYKRQLRQHGKRVISATEAISDDPTGILIESLLEGMAEYYSKELARKSRRGMLDNAEKCLANGKQPYGYRRGRDGRVELVEQEAAVVREIFEKVARGEAFVDITRNLNDRGIKTRLGNAWGQNSFGAILKNERYTGVYIFDGTRIEGGMPAIISKEDFMAVQRKLATKKNPQGRHRENGDYLLTGKLYCGKCKEHMIGTSGTARNGTVHHYYSCTGKIAGSCNCKSVKRDATELAIARAIRENVLQEEAIAWVADQVDAFQRQFKDSARLRELQQEQAANKKATDNVMGAIEQGIITATTRSRLLELEAAQAEISAKILAERSRTFRFTRDQVVTWLRSFSRRDVHDKEVQRQLFENFLIRAYLYDDGKVTLILNLFGDHSITIDFDPGTFDPDALSPDGSYNSFCGSPSKKRDLVNKSRFFESKPQAWYIITHERACISSTRKARCISSRAGVYLLRLDEIQFLQNG